MLGLVSFQGIPSFVGALYEHIAYSGVLAQTMEISVNLKACSFQLALMRILLSAGHIVVSMVTGNHHDRHQGYGLHTLSFQLRDNIAQMRPAFYGVYEHIAQLSGIQTVLQYGIVSVRRMRSTMCHQQNGFALAWFLKLGADCLGKFCHVIALVFLTHPVHDGHAAGHLLKIFLVQIENGGIISIFHAGEQVQGSDGYTIVTFSLELSHSLFRSRNGQTFFSLDPVHDNVAGESLDYLNIRMSSLNSCYRSVNGLFPAILKGGTKAHNHDGILVGLAHVLVVHVSTYANLSGLF